METIVPARGNGPVQATLPLRLLLVEDSEDDALLLEHELRDAGYIPEVTRVDTAEGLQSALRLADWDVIMSDNTLPGFSGWQALQMYRASGLDIPFLLVSGSIGEETAVEYMRAGAHDYLLKGNTARLVPALQRELAEAVHRRARRDSEHAYRETQARYQLIVESSSEGIYTANRRSCINFANGRLAEILGEHPDALRGRSIFRFVAPEDRDLAYQSWTTVTPSYQVRSDQPLTAEEPVEPLRLRLLRADGRPVWALVTASPIRDERGVVQGTLGMVTDISALQALEERVLRSEVEKKRFCRQVLQTVTKGKFNLVEPDEMPPLPMVEEVIPLDSAESFHTLRTRVEAACLRRGLAPEPAADFVLAVGEAAGNAVKHARLGCAQLCEDEQCLRVRVCDRGVGIKAEDLPASILQHGFSTAVSLGMGFSVMLELVDFIWLASGPEGTTVQLEKRLQSVEDPLLALLERFS